jgi:ABC-2 type transport system permease protein
MATIASDIPARPTRRVISTPSALTTLVRRRFALTARTPREIFVPLITPILFAVVIAPALKNALHAGDAYQSYVAVGTIGLLIPLNMMFSGIGVLVDRESGARRELLAAPIPRSLLVLANLAVALLVTGFQVAALIAAALGRGIAFHTSTSGVAWTVAAAVLFGVGMYGIAETLANRIPRQEEYIARLPAVAIVPWFLAGSLFPITALPQGLTYVAKLLPLTHALALMRYGLLDDPSALSHIWGMSNPTAMAALSLGVVALFAVALTTASIRVFRRMAVS